MRKRIARAVGAALLATSWLALDMGQAAAAEPQINMLHQWYRGSDAAAIAKLGEMFTAAGGKWEQTAIAGHTANTIAKLRADVIAGNAPPAVQLKGPEIAEWAATGLTANLNDVAEAENWDKLVAPQLIKVMKPEDVWVAAPMNIHRVNWMWGSKKALDKVGVTEMPKTWDEFNAVAEKMKAAGINPVAHSSQDWIDATLLDDIVYGMDIDLYRKAFIELDLDALRGDGMAKAFDQLRKMVGWTDAGMAGRDWDAVMPMFTKGELGFLFQGDWAIGTFNGGGLKEGVDYLCSESPHDRAGDRLHPQQRFGDLLQAEGRGLHRRPAAAGQADHVARVPDHLQPGQGLDPGADGRRPEPGLQPLPAEVAEGSAGRGGGRHAGGQHGAQHGGGAEVQGRDARGHHRVRQHAANGVQGRGEPAGRRGRGPALSLVRQRALR